MEVNEIVYIKKPSERLWLITCVSNGRVFIESFGDDEPRSAWLLEDDVLPWNQGELDID